ncbi:MAG: VOC family protein [Bosea sp. (in: a-proteobacteria)]
MSIATLEKPAPLEALNAPMHIGHVGLNVRDLAGMTAFYRDGMGLDVLAQDAGLSQLGKDGVAFLHLHHTPKAAAASPRAPGLFHTAFLVPTRADLGRWLAHAAATGLRLEGASDHIVSEALYLSDPEGNGIEIYVDRPSAEWRRQGEQIEMDTLPLDLQALLDEGTRRAAPWQGLASGSRIGHIHLKVGDAVAAEAFYAQTLGFTPTYRRNGASWLGAGGYHHHIAANNWASQGSAAGEGTALGLRDVGITVTDQASWGALAGQHAPTGTGQILMADPSGNRVILTKG